MLTATYGTFSDVLTAPVSDGGPRHWRASFDFTAAGTGVAELRLFLKSGNQTFSETWLYQYVTL
jgi:glucans biosynthesis protein